MLNSYNCSSGVSGVYNDIKSLRVQQPALSEALQCKKQWVFPQYWDSNSQPFSRKSSTTVVRATNCPISYVINDSLHTKITKDILDDVKTFICI